MKKIATLLVFAVFATAGSAFAGTTVLAPAGGVSGAAVQVQGMRTGGKWSIIGSLSSSVKIVINSNPSTFAIVTKHYNGTKFFGTSSNDTRLFYKDSASGLDVAACNCTASDSSAFLSWSSL